MPHHPQQNVCDTNSFRHAVCDTNNFRHAEHGAATVEADGLFAFVELASGIPQGPEHSKRQQAAARCDTRDDTLPRCASTFFFSRAELNFLSRTDSGLPAAETPSSASTPAPGSAARKVRSVVRREDILEELHVAVRLRGEPLFRRQKLQSSMD
jgi:hypothetical protein